jgi:6-phosphofructokinase 2
MPRFVTVTLNPALDLGCALPRMVPTHKIRVPGYHYDPGGGGLNVARVLHRLGAEVRALVLLGGHGGDWLATLLRAEGVDFEVVPVAAETRVCLNLHENETGLEYRIIPEGAPLTAAEADNARLAVAALAPRWLVASGSLAPGLPDDFYAVLARGRGAARIAVDSSGRALPPLRGQRLDLLKLSHSELALISGGTVAEVEATARALVADGTASMVAVTLGDAGAVLVDADAVVRLPARQVVVRSTVGAGDAFLAGLVLALDQGRDRVEALDFAIGVSAAVVASEGSARLAPL